MNPFKFLLVGLILSTAVSADVTMPYELKTYAIVKPGKISSSVSIGSGLVQKLLVELGQQVKPGTALIEIIEENAIRSYRSSMNGQVVKLHVTQGAAISPGMPLVTVMDPNNKLLEITLSPEEAKLVIAGSVVKDAKDSTALGSIEFISNLVDPDHGGVIAHVKKFSLSHRVGEVIHVLITFPELTCSKIIPLDKMPPNQKLKVRVIHQKQVCLE